MNVYQNLSKFLKPVTLSGVDNSGVSDVSSAVTALAGPEYYFPAGTYKFSTDTTFGTTGVNQVIKFDAGAKFIIDSGVTVTINCFIDAPPCEIFAGAGVVKIRNKNNENNWQSSAQDNTYISPYFQSVSCLWWEGHDIGEKINKAFAAGGSNTRVLVPAGHFNLTTTIDLDAAIGKHLTLEGVSFLATTLQIPNGEFMVGIDASTSDEITLANIRIIEQSGTRNCALMRVGGTSSQLDNVWLGNAKYAIYGNSGAGIRLVRSFVENSTYSIFLGTGHVDGSIGIDTTGNIRNVLVDSTLMYNASIHAKVYAYLVLDVTSGSISKGDVITGGSSGSVAEIFGVTSSGTGVCVLAEDNDFTASESFTTDGGASGTITTITQNGLYDVSISNIRLYGDGLLNDEPIIDLNFVDEFVIDGVARDCPGGGVILKNCDNFKMSMIAYENIDFGAKIENSNGIIESFVAGNRTGSNQKYGLVFKDCDTIVVGSSKLNTAIKMTGSADRIEVTDSDLSVHDIVDFDGVDDFIQTTYDFSADFLAADSIRIQFVLHEAEPVGNTQWICSFGQSSTNAVAIMRYNGNLRFVMATDGAIRAAIVPVLPGEYDVTFDRTTNTISVTDPIGATFADTSSSAGNGLRGIGVFVIGKRPGLNDGFLSQPVSQFALFIDGVSVSRWNGFGSTKYHWRDTVGSNHMSLSGTPTTKKAVSDYNETAEAEKRIGERKYGINSVTYSSDVTVDFDSNTADQKKITLTGDSNITLSTQRAGFYALVLAQDATGSREVTWVTAITGTAPTIATSANAQTLTKLFYDGTSWFWS